MDINFKDKTALITGGTSTVGKGIIKAFIDAGANVAFTYKTSDPDDILNQYKDYNIKAYKFEQMNVNEIKPLIDNIMNDFGSIDFLVNNAGIYPGKALFNITEDDFDKMMDTNNKGVFFLSLEVSKVMKQGSIINISSINATNPATRLVHYGISKAAVEMQTKCLAQQLGPDIRVNCIAPGLIYKKGQEAYIPGWSESYCERAPLNRLVNPEEIGKTAVFFASDLSSAITGQILTVDCGVSLAPYFFNELEEDEDE